MVKPKTRVLICDDHELVRRGIRDLLGNDAAIEIAGEAGSGTEAVSMALATRPNVILMDVRMPGMSGVEACRAIREVAPDMKILMLTSFTDDEALFGAIMAGAAGYILKQIRGAELLASIHKVAEGRNLLDDGAMARVMARLRGEISDGSPASLFSLSSLTAQERRLVVYVAEGKSNRQIATEMHLAEKTVKNYVSNILQKLGLARRAEVAPFLNRQHETTDPQGW